MCTYGYTNVYVHMCVYVYINIYMYIFIYKVYKAKLVDAETERKDAALRHDRALEHLKEEKMRRRAEELLGITIEAYVCNICICVYIYIYIYICIYIYMYTHLSVLMYYDCTIS